MATARSFDLRRPFVALAPFIHDERRFAPGDVVPWRDMGITERKLLAMWGNYTVGNAPPRPGKRPRAGA